MFKFFKKKKLIQRNKYRNICFIIYTRVICLYLTCESILNLCFDRNEQYGH